MIQPTHSNLQAQSPLRLEYVVELARLEQIERRLGTMLERENDLNIAQEIAHRLSNIQMILAINIRSWPLVSIFILKRHQLG
jgi:hypothetical protein